MRKFAQFLAAALISTVGLTGSALAQDSTASERTLSDYLDEKMQEHGPEIGKSVARLKRKADRIEPKSGEAVAEDLEAAGELLSDVFAKDGLFSELMGLMVSVTEDIDVDSHDGETVLRLDGDELGRISRDKTVNNDDRLSISGLGRNLTLDRETVVENGKTRTRIVIEMDGGDEIDIDLPELPERD